MSVMFATRDEASELIVECGKCGKSRLFSVVEKGEAHYELERCSEDVCSEHCLCAIPTLVNGIDAREQLSVISYNS